MFPYVTPVNCSIGLKVMLREMICNDDFQRNTTLQHCCDIVSNSYNIVPTLQRCVALKIVDANHFKGPCHDDFAVFSVVKSLINSAFIHIKCSVRDMEKISNKFHLRALTIIIRVGDFCRSSTKT